MQNIHLTENEIYEYLEKIENALRKPTHQFYEPSPSFSSDDSVSVNKEAIRMLDFVGLSNYTAVITYVKTKQNEGGNIELDNGKDVFIEINSELLVDKDKVLAVMAHEICHKVLFVNGLYYRPPIPQIENEKLTDLATIYVGFGKLTLNGCYKEFTTEFKEPNKIITTKHVERTGYLSLESFAIAYNAVCIRYGITSETNGLNKYAIDSVRRANIVSAHMPSLSELKEILKKEQSLDAQQMKAIVILENSINKMKSKIISNHKKFYDDFITPFDYKTDKIGNPFKAIAVFNQYSTVTHSYEVDEDIELLNQAIDIISKNKEIDYSVLLNIECPHCGYKKDNALKEHKEYFLKCPNCGYFFLWNASIQESNVIEDYKDIDKKNFIHKIKTIFK